MSVRQLVLASPTFLRVRETLTALAVRIPSVTTICRCKLSRISSLSVCSIAFIQVHVQRPLCPIPHPGITAFTGECASRSHHRALRLWAR